MKRGYKIGLWIVGAVWVIAMIALLPRFISLHEETRSAKRVFNEYRAALVRQDLDGAYQLCGTDFQKAMPHDEFVELQQNLQNQYGKLKSVSQKAFEVRGSGDPMYWRAVVDGDFVYERKTLRFEFVLHKEGERWVVFGAEQL